MRQPRPQYGDEVVREPRSADDGSMAARIEGEPGCPNEAQNRCWSCSATLALSACSGTVLELDVGTCFDDPENFEEVEEVPIVDCAAPHENEVFATQDPTGSEYPGMTEVENRASQICCDTFSEYVEIAYEESIYEFGSLFPTEETWAIGDREVICFAYDIELEKITGSINGAGQ
jgi:hypothetical protein